MPFLQPAWFYAKMYYTVLLDLHVLQDEFSLFCFPGSIIPHQFQHFSRENENINQEHSFQH
jgi:hypothetical protein